MERCFLFELKDRQVLGFDTGLDAAAFAKARLAAILTKPGYVVPPPPDITVQSWKPKGVIERENSMIIWGPSFGEGPVERLDRLVTAAAANAGPGSSADRALNTLGLWVRGRFLLPAGEILPKPFPAGALLSGDAILFPPEALVRRTVEGADWFAGAEQWTHPDLAGDAAGAFCAAALLYRSLCGIEPFPAKDIETLHLDIREGNFLPPALAAPGLDKTAEALIAGALNEGKLAPAPNLKTLGEFLRPSGYGDQPRGSGIPGGLVFQTPQQ